jgi:hypothetical protein
MNTENSNYSIEDVLKATEVLKHLENNTELLWHLSEEDRIDLYKAAGKVSRPNKEENKKRFKEAKSFEQKKVVEQNR